MSYDVIVTREGKDWLADVPALPGAHTFARSLPSLFTSIREVIILMDDLPDDAEPEFTVHYQVADELIAEADALRAERAEIARRENAVQAETAATVTRLTRAGYSVRDSAALLGLTPGRISQMTSKTDAESNAAARSA